jgi:hypothetical protein
MNRRQMNRIYQCNKYEVKNKNNKMRVNINKKVNNLNINRIIEIDVIYIKKK